MMDVYVNQTKLIMEGGGGGLSLISNRSFVEEGLSKGNGVKDLFLVLFFPIQFSLLSYHLKIV